MNRRIRNRMYGGVGGRRNRFAILLHHRYSVSKMISGSLRAKFLE